MKNSVIAGMAFLAMCSAVAIGDGKLRIVASDSEEVLKDLGDVAIVVDVNERANSEGFTYETIDKVVRRELTEAGISLVDNETSYKTPSQGYVYVQVLLVGEQAVITVNFNERVRLIRDPNTVVLSAQTYGDIWTGPHSSSKDKVWRALTRAVTSFGLKYAKANQKDG